MKPLLAEYPVHLSKGPTAPAAAAPHTLGILSGSTVWAASVGESRGRPGSSQHLPIVVCAPGACALQKEKPPQGETCAPLLERIPSATKTPHSQIQIK